MVTHLTQLPISISACNPDAFAINPTPSDRKLMQKNLPLNADRLMPMGSERVRQLTVLFLAFVSSRVETVQSALRHVMVAGAEPKFRCSHARNVAAISGYWCLCLLSPALRHCIQNRR